MFRSIRFRLTVWYTTVIVLTFISFSWITFEYLDQTLLSWLDQSISNEVEWIVARLERGENRKESDQKIKDDIFEHAAYYPLKEYIEIWDSANKLFYQSANLSGDTLINNANYRSGENWSLETLTDFRNYKIRIAVQKTNSFMVLLAMPMSIVTEPTSHLLGIFAWLGPILIITSIVGGTYLAKKSFSKVNQVIETVKIITADRLHDRIPESNMHDEIGNLISTFNDMISRIDNSFKQMKQFSADASHELRTPLSVIRSQLETALRSKVTVTQLKKIAANCLDETIHMTSIVENLLLLAKYDVGQYQLKFESVDLTKMIRQIYDEAVILASQKSITVTLKQLDNLSIIGDSQRVRQMVLNLIDNAIKYSNLHGRIHMSLINNNGSAEIIVSDNGIGIAKSEISKIFDRFYRVDRARTRSLGGSGLGLSIAKIIAEAHGGEISVDTEINRGSTFKVLIPISNSF